jgi:hypothetical protein
VFSSTIPEIVDPGYNIYLIDAQIPKNTCPKFTKKLDNIYQFLLLLLPLLPPNPYKDFV